jgi:putative endonuclease
MRLMAFCLLWEQEVPSLNLGAPTILPRPARIKVYVLKSKAGKRYVGITNDLSRRLRELGLKKTKSGQLMKDFFVLHTEEFPDYKKARIREKFLKSGQGRKWLDTLELKSESARGG